MNITLTLIPRGYLFLCRLASSLQPAVLLFFRLPWGYELYKNGAGKLKNHADIVDFFTSLGIPLPDLNAWFVGGLECFGGLAIVFGLCSRPVSLMLAVNMTVAYLAVKDDRSLFLNMFASTDAFDAFTKADPFFYWLMAIVILAFGPGQISLDKLLAVTAFKRFQVPKSAD
ncbi:MAG: DoxX family protein [Cyanobacteria bacterium REEB67]|nr:DoxX family protein [Cyanobacteria bacterium REEB67]